VPVRVPKGCLVLQAGQQLAWMTGGDIKPGMHEVVCTSATVSELEKAREAGQRPLWRVSSTVFAHLSPNVMMKPIVGTEEASSYTPTLVSNYVKSELERIKLSQPPA
jgi:isopenicillin N synthase-like dioxygenase